MANLKDLQQATSDAAGKASPAPRKPLATVTQAIAPVSVPAIASSSAPENRPTSRAGKIPMTFHLAADFKRSLRLVQAYRGGTFEQLAAEAFNDLFSKYNAPTVNNEP